MRAASIYQLQRFMEMNEKYLQESLTMQNIFSLLKFSDSLQAQEAKEICLDFALKQSDFFTSSSAENLGFKLFQEVTALLLKFHTNPRVTNAVRKITAVDTIVADFQNLLSSADVTGDVTFTINGMDIKGHRAIFAGYSMELALLVKPDKDKEGKEKISATRSLPTVPDAFRAFMRFMYYSETAIQYDHALALLDFSKTYQLHKLTPLLNKIISAKSAPQSEIDKYFAKKLGTIMSPEEAKERAVMKEMGLSELEIDKYFCSEKCPPCSGYFIR